jgi:hypothetical protein
MKVGDLVQTVEKRSPSYTVHGKRSGIVVEIDPLLKRRDPELYEMTMVEVVVLLSCGKLWHARPTDWEVISEDG